MHVAASHSSDWKNNWSHSPRENALNLSTNCCLGIDPPRGGLHNLSRAHPESRVSAAIPESTIIGPVLEFQIVNILGQPGLEMSLSINSQTRNDISRCNYQGNEAFCGKIHNHKNDLRSSTEFLSAFQKSKGREPCVEKNSNNMKKTCALPVTSRCDNKEACANNLSNPPSDFLFKKTICPANEKNVDCVNPSHGGAFSIQVSKMTPKMVRHHDQDERD